MFRLEAKIFSREKRGRSVVAAAAYRAALKLEDERGGRIYNYTRRSKGVMDTAIVAPEGSPEWVFDPARLWNSVEDSEVRKDAQLAREFILSVPPELTPQEQFDLATKWARAELVSKGMIVELSLHQPKSGKNPHVHALCTLRKIEGMGFGSKKPREWNDVGLLHHQRESWADAVNTALEKAGRPERVTHKSLKDQGIDRQPQPKIGPEATAMKRRGVVADPDNFKKVREVKLLNEVRPMMRAIEHGGEVAQKGHGATWWERSITFMSRIRQKVVTGWRKLLDSKRDEPPFRGR